MKQSKKNKSRKTNDEERQKLIDEARLKIHNKFFNNVYEGDYTAIYLYESNRKRDNPASKKWTTEFIPKVRYGKFNHEDIMYLKQYTATESQTKEDSWNEKTIMCSRHYFSEKYPDAENVETVNMKHLIQYAKENKLDLVKIEAQHFPVKDEKNLKGDSAKLFRNLPAVIALCKGVKFMLCENINPSVGLFNGAECKYKGQIYLPKCIKLVIPEKDPPDIILKSGISEVPFDCKVSGKDYYIPKGTLVKQNDECVSHNNIKEIPSGSEIALHLPETFPSLPDYLVFQIDNFDTVSGGNHILFEGYPDLANCTLIPTRMFGKETDKKNKKPPEHYRVSFPVELMDAYTPFKGQGATQNKTDLRIPELYGVPGVGYVGMTRVREPEDLHIPPNQFPNHWDLRLQRLKKAVIESENFEREVRIKCAKTELFINLSEDQQVIAEHIIYGWRNFQKNDSIISDNNLDITAFNEVLQLLESTEVSLLRNPTPPLTDEEREFLERYKKSKSTNRNTGKKTSSKQPNTSKSNENKSNQKSNTNTDNNTNQNETTSNNNNASKSSSKKKFTAKTNPQPSTSRSSRRSETQVLPKFYNTANTCWLNSSMHIVLLLLKYETQRLLVNSPLQKKFWEKVDHMLQQYETCTTPTNLCVPNVFHNRENWSMRRLFSYIAYGDNGVDNNRQQDAIECLENFLRNQEKLPNFRIVYTLSKTCQICSHIIGNQVNPENIFKLQVVQNGPPTIDVSTALLKTSEVDAYCDQCGGNRKFIETTQFIHVPDLFLIDFKRWQDTWRDLGEGQFIQLPRIFVNTPISTLDNITINTVDNIRYTYNAIAAISYNRYEGEEGHYYASVRIHNEWYIANDENISRDVNGPQVPRLLLLKKAVNEE